MRRVITKYVPDANRSVVFTSDSTSKWIQKHPKFALKTICKHVIKMNDGCYVVVWRHGIGYIAKYGIENGMDDRFSILKEL